MTDNPFVVKIAIRCGLCLLSQLSPSGEFGNTSFQKNHTFHCYLHSLWVIKRSPGSLLLTHKFFIEMKTSTLKTKTLNLHKIEKLMTHKTDALTPRIIDKIFGTTVFVDEDLPEFLTASRMKELHNQQIGMIAFPQITMKGIYEQFENKQSGEGLLLFDNALELYGEETFFHEEGQRPGLCLMGMRCIPGSKGKDSLFQSLMLVDYVNYVLPELSKTVFWKDACAELKQQTPVFRNMINSARQEETVEPICNLEVNKYFRPRISEVFSYATAYERHHGTRIFEDEYTLTNTVAHQPTQFVSFGIFDDDDGANIEGIQPDYGVEGTGVSFFCSLDWLKAVI